MRRFDPERDPHRRKNLLTGQYVLVSPQRTLRPWQGQTESAPAEHRPPYDPSCYLCPGNRRAGSAVNPGYQGTFVFDNDFPALVPEIPPPQTAPSASSGAPSPAPGAADPMWVVEPVAGACRVICFSPRHDLTLAGMDVKDITGVIDVWASETAALGQKYRWVQVFENKGAVMGCSNPHPHGQVWAETALPNEAAAEDREQRAYHQRHGSPLLLDYGAREQELATRVVCESEDFLAVVPFWAVWPFETLVLPRARVARLPDLTASARADLAALLRALLSAYDRLFGVSFPYSMGWHGAPFSPDTEAAAAAAVGGPADGGGTDYWQLHAHIYPPLLRSATVKKFMVGYEMLGEPQRDLTAEQAAERLRALVGAPSPPTSE